MVKSSTLHHFLMRVQYIGRWLRGVNTFFRLGWQYNLSPEADYRLNVLGYYFGDGGKNASKTGRHFGLHRNSIGNWIAVFDPRRPQSLEPKKPVPIKRHRKKT